MGSHTDNDSAAAREPEQQLPDAGSEALVLTHPTEEEKRRTWTLNHREWGGALTLEQYLVREPYLATVPPLTRDGGMTHWILTTATADGSGGAPASRPVLASCESIRKRVLVARPPPAGGNGESEIEVEESVGYGVGSVYTYPEYRGRSYAKRMLKELGGALRTWPSQQQQQQQKQGDQTNGGAGKAPPKEAACSALWSDLGKVFYAKKGWPPFPSAHASFPAAATAAAAQTGSQQNGDGNGLPLPSEPITRENLARFAALDEAQLRRRLARTASRTGRPAFAFAPDQETLLWHMHREDFISSQVFENSAGNNSNKAENGPAAATGEAVNGAAAAAGSGSGSGNEELKGLAVGHEGRRVWAVWTRNYYAGPENPHKNTLYILRLVVEGADEDGADGGAAGAARDRGELRAAFAAIVDAARGVAARWGLAKVDLWNPNPLVRGLLADIAGDAPHEWVERDVDSIPSLMWYGGEAEEDVQWVANEKYCWC